MRVQVRKRGNAWEVWRLPAPRHGTKMTSWHLVLTTSDWSMCMLLATGDVRHARTA